MEPASTRSPWVWDYDLTLDDYEALLRGDKTIGRLDRDWASVRLIEYGPYSEIVRLIGFSVLVKGWPVWRERVRSDSRRRGLDFLTSWLVTSRPDLL